MMFMEFHLSSILYLYFKCIDFSVKYYIPNRLEEGYGVNEDAIRKIYDDGCDLIITVDCGITSVNEVCNSKRVRNRCYNN